MSVCEHKFTMGEKTKNYKIITVYIIDIYYNLYLWMYFIDVYNYLIIIKYTNEQKYLVTIITHHTIAFQF